MTTPSKTPQDHKKKAEKPDGSHTFTAAGRKYTLPPIDEDAAGRIPGEVTYNALLHPDDGAMQARLGFATIEATNVPAAVKKALLSLPTAEMVEVIAAWLGESQGSSD